MPDEHFYKSIMNKCVFAWLSSRQARLFLYSRAKLLIIIRFTKYSCIFFPPISPCFHPFLPISRHYPPHLHFLTIGMGVKCFARARCFARVRCFARWKCKVLRTGKVLRTRKFIGARTFLRSTRRGACVVYRSKNLSQLFSTLLNPSQPFSPSAPAVLKFL